MSQATRTRYRIIGPLGEGGMARVYRAEDTLLGRIVALKVLREQFAGDEPFLEGFRQEAQAAAQLSHPNIVALYDVSELDGLPCLIMECVDGGNLKDLLKAGPLPLGHAVDVAIQIAEAVAAAHAKGIIHRDIKPQNVLVQKAADGDDARLPSAEPIRVKITDFGIARALGVSSRSAGTGEIVGTIHYLSPEQIQGKAASPASDVYAIGVVLYEMLTGRLPFVAESAIAVALKHIQEEPEPPSAINPAIPPALEAIVLRALAKNPAERFDSAGALARALREYRDFGQQATATFRPLRALDAMPALAATAGAAPTARRGIDWVFVLLAVTTLLLLGGLIALGGMAYRNVSEILALAARPSPTQPMTTLAGTPTSAPTPTATPSVAAVAIPTPTVTLTPTATPQPLVKVPDLRRLTLAQAQQRAAEQGLKVEQTGQDWSDAVPAGRVLQQSAAPSTEVPEGSTIGVVISRGSQVVQVPSVVGLAYADAEKRLIDLGLNVSRRDEWNDKLAAGLVFAQDPATGSVAAGSTITLSVSRGPEMVAVPQLVGKSEGEALELLKQSRLKLFRWGINYQGHSDLPAPVLERVPVGHVLSTRPEGGTLVPVGSEVEIAVRKD